jgi:ribose-phosphate pyrophosphokinase
MIKVSGPSTAQTVIVPSYYSDGTMKLCNINNEELFFEKDPAYIKITWLYEYDEEMIFLMYLVKHFRDISESEPKIELIMPYIPNARMDRVKNKNEVFTLKYFAEFINSLNFWKIKVLDPHSDVSVSLLNKVHVDDSELAPLLFAILMKIKERDIILYFPDASAKKRYNDLVGFLPCQCACQGYINKNHDTGEVINIDFVCDCDITLKGKNILIVDDIISYGKTMYHSAKKLKELGVEKIYAFASHVEETSLHNGYGMMTKAFNEGLIEKLFTTNSIYVNMPDNEKVEVVYTF